MRVPALVLTLAGCGAEIAAPITLELEVARLDVDEQRTRLENTLCDSASQHCDTLRALDRSDDGVAATAPRMPPLMPKRLDNELDVAQWVDTVRIEHALLPRHTFSFTAPSIELTIDDAAILFHDSSLSFAMPAFDLFLDGELIARSDAHPAATDGRANLYFADGATDRLRAAQDAELELVAGDASLALLEEQGKLRRPGGAAQISLFLSCTLPASLLLDR